MVEQKSPSPAAIFIAEINTPRVSPASVMEKYFMALKCHPNSSVSLTFNLIFWLDRRIQILKEEKKLNFIIRVIKESEINCGANFPNKSQKDAFAEEFAFIEEWAGKAIFKEISGMVKKIDEKIKKFEPIQILFTLDYLHKKVFNLKINDEISRIKEYVGSMKIIAEHYHSYIRTDLEKLIGGCLDSYIQISQDHSIISALWALDKMRNLAEMYYNKIEHKSKIGELMLSRLKIEFIMALSRRLESEIKYEMNLDQSKATVLDLLEAAIKYIKNETTPVKMKSLSANTFQNQVEMLVRKFILDYDGKIETGEWVCNPTPQQMKNAESDNPLTFTFVHHNKNNWKPIPIYIQKIIEACKNFVSPIPEFELVSEEK